MSERTLRMVESAPNYYQESHVYESLQDAQAQEYDRQEGSDLDLQDQLYATTATWGLRYWEEALGIPVKESDSYEARRGRVIAKLIGEGNFSAKLLIAIAQGYGQTIRVEVDVAAFMVTVTFQQGIPSFLEEYQEIVESIIHAHLGTEYKFEYHYTTTLGVDYEYKRWVYDLPVVGLLCGTWPYVVEGQQTYEAAVGADEEGYTVTKDFNYCGTIMTSEGAKL